MGRPILLPDNETDSYLNMMSLDPHGRQFHSEYYGGQHTSYWYAFGLICLAIFLTFVILLCCATTMYFWYLNNQKYDPTQQNQIEDEEAQAEKSDPDFDTFIESSFGSGPFSSPRFNRSRDGRKPVIIGNSNRVAKEHARAAARARRMNQQSILTNSPMPNRSRNVSPNFLGRSPSRSPVTHRSYDLNRPSTPNKSILVNKSRI